MNDNELYPESSQDSVYDEVLDYIDIKTHLEKVEEGRRDLPDGMEVFNDLDRSLVVYDSGAEDPRLIYAHEVRQCFFLDDPEKIDYDDEDLVLSAKEVQSDDECSGVKIKDVIGDENVSSLHEAEDLLGEWDVLEIF